MTTIALLTENTGTSRLNEALRSKQMRQNAIRSFLVYQNASKEREMLVKSREEVKVIDL